MAAVTSVTSGPPRAQGVRAGGAEAAYGLCYGTNTSPTPDPLVEIYKSHNISRMWLSPATLSPTDKAVTKILDLIISDPDLTSKIKVFLWIDYKDFNLVADDENNAKNWVDAYVNPYKGVIGHVCVGDVIGPRKDFSLAKFRGGMSNLKKHLSDAIKLSTIVNEIFLFGKSHSARTPPSKCVLTDESRNLLQVLSQHTVSPIPLFFAIMPHLMIGRDGVVVNNCILDPVATTYMQDNEYSYSQVFDAMVDSIYCALRSAEELGQVDIIAVTGWPTKGSNCATVTYATQYIHNNLVPHIANPTPMNYKPADIFIYSLVDENQLDDPSVEYQHLGAEAFLPSP